MRIKEGYRIRKVGSKSVVVAPGGINFTGLITVNETGTFIWSMLEKGAESEEIVSSLAKECNVRPEDIKGDVTEFVDALKGADILE